MFGNVCFKRRWEIALTWCVSNTQCATAVVSLITLIRTSHAASCLLHRPHVKICTKPQTQGCENSVWCCFILCTIESRYIFPIPHRSFLELPPAKHRHVRILARFNLLTHILSQHTWHANALSLLGIHASLPKNGFPMIHRQFTFYFLDILTMFNPRIHHQSIKKTSTISRLYQQQVSVLHPNTKSCLMVR